MDARILGETLDVQAEFDDFIKGLAGEGAVTSFVGLARPTAAEGATVAGLFLDHHPTLTAGSVGKIAEEAKARFAVTRVSVVHRYGKVPAGEPVVFVAAAASHRRPAFEAADYMMDRLKTEALFWKREDTDDGSSWIEPSERDFADTRRWSE